MIDPNTLTYGPDGAAYLGNLPMEAQGSATPAPPMPGFDWSNLFGLAQAYVYGKGAASKKGSTPHAAPTSYMPSATPPVQHSDFGLWWAQYGNYVMLGGGVLLLLVLLRKRH